MFGVVRENAVLGGEVYKTRSFGSGMKLFCSSSMTQLASRQYGSSVASRNVYGVDRLERRRKCAYLIDILSEMLLS